MSVLKVTGSGLSLGRNPLTDSSGLAEAEGITIRDQGIIEPLPGLGSQQSTGSSSLVRQLGIHEDEIHGEHVAWVDAAGNLSLAKTSDVTTKKSVSGVESLNPSYDIPAIAQVNEHTTLVASSRKTIAVRPASAVADSVMQEAGLPELTSCQARVYGNADEGWLQVGSASAYRAALERSYGDNHLLESAPSGRGIVRNSILLPAGSITRSTTTITITCAAPHGITSTGVPVVLAPENGPLDQNDNITPAGYLVASVPSEYQLTVTAWAGSASATNTRPYRLYVGSGRSQTFFVATGQMSKASSEVTVTLPANHGIPVGALEGWSIRIYQTTGMTLHAAFPVGTYACVRVPAINQIVCSEYTGGSTTSNQPYFVALIPPSAAGLTDLLDPTSNAVSRRTLVDVPIPTNGTLEQKIKQATPDGIATGTSWVRTGLSAVNSNDTAFYPGRGRVNVATLIDRNATGDHKLSQGSLTLVDGKCVVSVVSAESPTCKRVGFVLNAPNGYHACLFDVFDAAVVASSPGVTGRVVDEGAGFKRCSMEVTVTAGAADVAFFLVPDNATGYWTNGGGEWGYTGTASRYTYLYAPRIFQQVGVRTNYFLQTENILGPPYEWQLTNLTGALVGTEAVPVAGSVKVFSLTSVGANPNFRVLSSLNTNFGDTATVSVYVRRRSGSCRVGVATVLGLPYYGAVYDLSAGSVVAGTVSSGCSAAMVAVGGGWFRCEFSCAGADYASVWLLDSGETQQINIGGSNWTSTLSGDSVDVAALQLEGGVGVSPYKATTTAPVSAALTYDGQTVPPAEVGDTVTLYRSAVSDDPTGRVEPADDCYGVNTRVLTLDDLAEGRVRFLELRSSDRLLTSPCYTNPTDGAVENAPNVKPPVAYDVTEWDARAWLGNVIPRPRLAITLLGTTGSGLVAGDQFVIRRNDTSEVRVFPAVAPGTTNPGAFAVHTLGTVSENVELTVRDLVRAINACDPCSIKAYYSGSDFTSAGQIVLETKDAGGPQDSPGFSFDVLDSSGRRKIGPITNPSPGATSDNEHLHNGVQFSKQNEHESWPILNTVRFGARQDFVRKMFGFRDRLYVFTRYGGVFVVVGPYPYRVLGPISSAKLLGSRCVTEFADNVWCLTDQGLGYVTDSGFVVASADVDRAWRDLLGPDGQAEVVGENAFMVGDDANGLLYVWIPAISGSASAAATCYVYNIRTRSWSTWTRSAQAATVSPTTGKVWVAATSSVTGANAQLATVRRAGTSDDNADMAVSSVTLTLNAGSYYAPYALPAGTKLTRSGVDYWLVSDATTNVPPHGYGPLVTSRTSAFAPAGTTGWTVTLPVPASIQFHPVDAGDFGVRKLFSQLQLAWSEETDLAESLVAVAPDDADFGADLVMPATTRRLQRVEPLPRTAADTNALKVRVRVQQAQKAWRLLGLRLELASGAPGRAGR